MTGELVGSSPLFEEYETPADVYERLLKIANAELPANMHRESLTQWREDNDVDATFEAAIAPERGFSVGTPRTGTFFAANTKGQRTFIGSRRTPGRRFNYNYHLRMSPFEISASIEDRAGTVDVRESRYMQTNDLTIGSAEVAAVLIKEVASELEAALRSRKKSAMSIAEVARLGMESAPAEVIQHTAELATKDI